MLIPTKIPAYATPEWYDAKRSISVLMCQYGEPGEIEIEAIDYATARLIAEDQYDVESLSRCDNGSYAIKTRGGYSAIVGTFEGQPAILHKEPDGTRKLEVLKIVIPEHA
jgi:hypothetical protein